MMTSYGTTENSYDILKDGVQRKKRKTVMQFVIGLLLIAAFFLVTPSQVNAASAKTKALKAYEKFLKKSTVSIGGERVRLSSCRFAVIYLNNDSVPELVLNFELADNPWTNGAVYTCKSGKVKLVSTISFMDSISYYKKTGTLVDCYLDDMGSFYYYYKMPGTGMKNMIYRVNYRNVSYLPKSQRGKTLYYRYQYPQKKISKSVFNKRLKSMVGSKKATKIVVRKNTGANRKKYLK